MKRCVCANCVSYDPTQKIIFLKTEHLKLGIISHVHSVAHCASVVKRAKRFSDRLSRNSIFAKRFPDRLSRNSIIVCLYFGPLVSGESVVADVTRKYHLRIHTPRNSMWVRQQAGGPNYGTVRMLGP